MRVMVIGNGAREHAIACRHSGESRNPGEGSPCTLPCPSEPTRPTPPFTLSLPKGATQHSLPLWGRGKIEPPHTTPFPGAGRGVK